MRIRYSAKGGILEGKHCLYIGVWRRHECFNWTAGCIIRHSLHMIPRQPRQMLEDAGGEGRCISRTWCVYVPSGAR